MARKCSMCRRKVSVIERKYWAIDSNGKKESLCVDCAANVRSQFDQYLLTNGYTRLEVHPFPEFGLWTPLVCAICGESINDKTRGKEKSLTAHSSDGIYEKFLNYSLNTCARCSGIRLDPCKFARVLISGELPDEIFYEIGNEEVADIYKFGLEKQMEEYREQFKQHRDEASGREKELWEGLMIGTKWFGIRSSIRLKPGDKDWI